MAPVAPCIPITMWSGVWIDTLYLHCGFAELAREHKDVSCVSMCKEMSQAQRGNSACQHLVSIARLRECAEVTGAL